MIIKIIFMYSMGCIICHDLHAALVSIRSSLAGLQRDLRILEQKVAPGLSDDEKQFSEKYTTNPLVQRWQKLHEKYKTYPDFIHDKSKKYGSYGLTEAPVPHVTGYETFAEELALLIAELTKLPDTAMSQDEGKELRKYIVDQMESQLNSRIFIYANFIALCKAYDKNNELFKKNFLEEFRRLFRNDITTAGIFYELRNCDYDFIIKVCRMLFASIPVDMWVRLLCEWYDGGYKNRNVAFLETYGFAPVFQVIRVGLMALKPTGYEELRTQLYGCIPEAAELGSSYDKTHPVGR